jgi:arginyl-tRNA synthetase
MRLTKILKKPPLSIGQNIKELLEKNGTLKKEGIEKIEVVNPGFINFFLTDQTLSENLVKPHEHRKAATVPKKNIMVEFAHPNTHKAFHIGHLRNIITGECIVRLLEANGNTVIRANYQGDVGLHIAKALYGISQNTQDTVENQNKNTIDEKIQFLSACYVMGNTAYEEQEHAKKEIIDINKKIYAKDPTIYPLYQKTRKWSLEYFERIYKRVYSHFDRFYFESETFNLGKKLVTEYTDKGIFEKSDGAVIFPGEKYGLHNRVFITSEGNPTYEGKDVGLAKLQFDEFHPDQIIHCVASEQTEYFRVIFEAIAQVFPETQGKEYHLIYGWVRLKDGKMSSRSGNVVLGEWLLDETKKEMLAILQNNDHGYTHIEKEDIAEKTAIAAVKYAFLKVSTQQEIAFDIKESVNIEGDSGPYLLYTYARCQSVLQKAKNTTPVGTSNTSLTQEQRNVMRLLMYFSEIVLEVGNRYAPNILCTYLFSLAQAFNVLYAKQPILGNQFLLLLTQKTAETVKSGLNLLGIQPVERM